MDGSVDGKVWMGGVDESVWMRGVRGVWMGVWVGGVDDTGCEVELLRRLHMALRRRSRLVWTSIYMQCS